MDDQNVPGIGLDSPAAQFLVAYYELLSLCKPGQKTMQAKDLVRMEELVGELSRSEVRTQEAVFVREFCKFFLHAMKTIQAQDMAWRQYQEQCEKRNTSTDAKQQTEEQAANREKLRQMYLEVQLELAAKNQMLLDEVAKLRADLEVLQQKEIVARLDLEEKNEENQMLANRVAKLRSEVIALRKSPK